MHKQHSNSPARNGQHSQIFEQAFACSPHGQNPEAWLKDQIEYYSTEAARLERELKHVQVLLKGHRTWLADIERRGGKS